MSLLDIVRSAQGEDALAELGRRHGLDQAQTERALDGLVPELGRAFLDRSAGPHAAGIHAAIEDQKHLRFLDDSRALQSAEAEAEGNRLLDRLLGRGEVDRIVARAGEQSGVDNSALRRLLPVMTTLAMAALTKEIDETTPRLSGHLPGAFGTSEQHTSGDPLARGLASLFGDEDVSIRRKP